MAEDDFSRAGTGRSGGGAGHRAATTPPRHRSTVPLPARARAALRRWPAPLGQRRLAAAGLALLASLTALLAYVGTRPESDPALPGGLPAGAGRSTGFPAIEANRSDTGPATPGLQPRQRQPTLAPSPSATPPTPNAPAPPLLTVTQGDIPAEVDLTAAGPRDWVHWGLRGGESIVRKRDGSGEIVDEGGSGARGGWDGNQEIFSWRDGTRERTVDGTPNGVYTCGTGSGFALAVAASGELRTVRLYAGLWMARARLEARLSVGGPTTTVRMEDPHTSRSAEFTLRFRAPEGARLLITWTTEAVFSRDCGNVGLQAVALR
ncbi:hypothetical protein [Micromonospora sp. WMMD812]|uniref:hypothetical protein n=1 Tax=Micromonospora sp. WMMD812 TaxID=3015152 RepID=UPI00248C9460|nr:hypothetical protein [Micromonospora sp. WMMD812]WBB70690.1 hypothetical protein O7603_15605 [Micromonospora sp. WMMD812]